MNFLRWLFHWLRADDLKVPPPPDQPEPLETGLQRLRVARAAEPCASTYWTGRGRTRRRWECEVRGEHTAHRRGRHRW